MQSLKMILEKRIIVSPKVRYTPLGVYLGRGLLPTGSNPTFGDTI